MTELIERFERGATAAGVPNDVYDELERGATPSALLAPALLDLVPRASEQGLFAVAGLALHLADDPAYRPVVELVMRERPVRRPWNTSLHREAHGLGSDAVGWWFDLLTSGTTSEDVDHQLTLLILQRAPDLVLRRHDAVVAHLVARPRGPAFWVCDAAGGVLQAGGPCPPLEHLWARWIDDGRFDGTYDQPDGTTSAVFLAAPLGRCVTDGPFTPRWELLDHALAHWRDLLADPERHALGLRAMADVLDRDQDLAGRLPGGVLSALPPGSQVAAVIERGFAKVALRRRSEEDKHRYETRDEVRWLLRASGLYPHLFGD